jgi:hypothetical protein
MNIATCPGPLICSYGQSGPDAVDWVELIPFFGVPATTCSGGSSSGYSNAAAVRRRSPSSSVFAAGSRRRTARGRCIFAEFNGLSGRRNYLAP